MNNDSSRVRFLQRLELMMPLSARHLLEIESDNEIHQLMYLAWGLHLNAVAPVLEAIWKDRLEKMEC